MKKKLFIFGLAAVILVAGGVYTFDEGRNYVAKKVIEKLVQSEEVKEYRDKVEKAVEENEDLIKEAAKNANGVAGRDDDENEDLSKEKSGDEKSDKSGNDDKKLKDNNGKKSDKDNNNEKSKAKSGDTQADKKSSSGSGGGNVDADAYSGDFWSHPLVQSVYSRFSSGEISQVMHALSGNATGAEKKAAKQMIFSKVSSAEISQLQELYNKYN